jgi:WD40 repeat protein
MTLAALHAVVYSDFNTLISSRLFVFKDNSSSSELLDTIDALNPITTFISLTNDSFAIGFEGLSEIHIWNWQTKAQIRKLIGHKTGVNALVKFKDNITIASASNDKSIKIWNTTSGILLREISPLSNSAQDMLLLSNGNLVFGGEESVIYILNSTNGNYVKVLAGHDYLSGLTSMQLIGEDCLASGSHDKSVRFWNLTTGKEIKTVFKDSEVVQCILLLNNTQLLASAEWDCYVNIWDLQTSQMIGYLEHSSRVYSLLNLKQDHLACGCQEGVIKIWNYNSGQLLQILKGHASLVSRLILLSDGNLASCSKDRTIKIWNLPVIYNYPNRANLIASVDD